MYPSWCWGQAANPHKQPTTRLLCVCVCSLKPIDRDAIAASIRKTHRVLSVEEGWPQHGVGSGACAALCGRVGWRVGDRVECFDDVDPPSPSHSLTHPPHTTHPPNPVQRSWRSQSRSASMTWMLPPSG